MVIACGEIVAQLIQAVQQGRDVNLNGALRGSTSCWAIVAVVLTDVSRWGRPHAADAPVALKSNVSRELRLKNQPKLVEIIAAIPEEYKPVLLPKLKAKPVRTASGVRARTLAQRIPFRRGGGGLTALGAWAASTKPD